MPIRKWHLKAAVQKTISYLPRPERVNALFQRYVTGGVVLDDEHFGYKFGHALDHLRFTRTYGNRPIAGCEVLELGTGWYPIVPILWFLHGAERVVSLDIQSWLTAASLRTALERVHAALGARPQVEGVGERISEQRYATIEALLADPAWTLADACGRLRFEPRLLDARRTDYPDASFDVICSNNTFEHIYPDVLESILREFRRLLRPGGLMTHFVDLSDHFAHFDHSINIYNFLRYSEAAWSRIDNSIQPQNRLRWPDYRAMYARAGVPITVEEVRAGDRKALAAVDVHPEFWGRGLTEEEVAVSHGYLVSVV